MEIVVSGGQITCVQQDDIDLTQIGSVRNTRASTVEWIESMQMWRAEIKPEFRKNRNVEDIYYSTSRKDCIDWEVQYLEEQISENSLNQRGK